MHVNIFIGLVQFIVLLLSLSVHECAHAWTASKLGDQTARRLGRVSLNPLVHADLFGTVIFPLMGLFTGLMFGWAKPVPVDISRLRKPARDHMIVAAAGPLSNIAIALSLFGVLMAVKSLSPEGASLVRDIASFDVPSGNSILVPLTIVAFQGVILNIVLAVFNLIPVAPLDGAAVLAGFIPRSLSGAFHWIQQYGFMILIVLMISGATNRLFIPVLSVFVSYLSL